MRRRHDEVGPPAGGFRLFAGMTNRGAGALGKVGWPPMHRGSLATLLTAPLDSGLRRNDEVGRAGMTKWGAGMTKWGAGAGRPGASDALEALPHPSTTPLDSRPSPE